MGEPVSGLLALIVFVGIFLWAGIVWIWVVTYRPRRRRRHRRHSLQKFSRVLKTPSRILLKEHLKEDYNRLRDTFELFEW